MTKIEEVGKLKEEVILQLDLENVEHIQLNALKKDTPILCSDSTWDHVKKRHPDDYVKYKSDLGSILEEPDYIGIHPKSGSIEYFKEYQNDSTKERVIVAIRATKNQSLFVRTLYVVSNNNFENYLEKQTIQQYKRR